MPGALEVVDAMFLLSAPYAFAKHPPRTLAGLLFDLLKALKSLSPAAYSNGFFGPALYWCPETTAGEGKRKVCVPASFPWSKKLLMGAGICSRSTLGQTRERPRTATEAAGLLAVVTAGEQRRRHRMRSRACERRRPAGHFVSTVCSPIDLFHGLAHFRFWRHDGGCRKKGAFSR